MLRVSAEEFERDIAKYQDIARREPVTVTRDGQEETVLVSAEEFRYMRFSYRRALGPDDFTEEDLRAIENTPIPEALKAFDHELED